ncbi:MAG: hypothetical protein RLZZ292_3814, partial [Bacteroidota bacterium]
MSNTIKLKTTDKKRVEAIILALHGRVNLYPQEDILFIPILDVFSLLYQKPVAISFFDEEKLLYTTLEDPELAPNYKHYFEKNKQEFQTLAIEINKDAKVVKIIIHIIHKLNDFEVLSKYEHQKLAYLFHSIKINDWGQDMMNDIVSWLYSNKNVPNMSLKMAVPKVTISADEFEKFVKPLRDALDKTFKDIWNAQLLRIKNNSGLSIPNLFCVLKTATIDSRRNDFNYTAQVLLTHKQKNVIQEWLKGKGEKNALKLVENIEIPLGKKARSIADSSFASGLIDFSHEQAGEGRDDYGNSTLDLLRGEAEQLVYSQIYSPNRVFFVPIHVEGVTWLSLFTLTNVDDDNDAAWEHNYHVYMSIIPVVSNNIRIEAREVFIKVVSEIILNYVKTVDNNFNCINAINEDLVKISAIYPFCLFEIQPITNEVKLENDNLIRLYNNSFYKVVTHKNKFFLNQVEYASDEAEFIDEVTEKIKNAFKEGLEAYDVIRKVESAQAFLGVGHFLKTRVSPARTELDDTNYKFEQYLKNTENKELWNLYYQYSTVSQKFRNVYHTGLLMNILSQNFQTETNPFMENPKEEWISKDWINIHDIFQKFEDYSFEGKKPNFIFSDSDMILKPFIKSREGSEYIEIRPNDFFYDEIFIELVSNACKNG